MEVQYEGATFLARAGWKRYGLLHAACGRPPACQNHRSGVGRFRVCNSMPRRSDQNRRRQDCLLYGKIRLAQWIAALIGPRDMTQGKISVPSGGGRRTDSPLQALDTVWCPDEVKLRLEEAGRTLMSLPMPRHGLPAEMRSNWPEVVRGYEDAFAALIGASRSAKQDFADHHNRVRVAASARDVARMDEALEWLWRIDDSRKRRLCLCRALIHPVSGRHIASFRRLGRLFGLHHDTVRAWHERALGELAGKLTSAKVLKARRRGRRRTLS